MRLIDADKLRAICVRIAEDLRKHDKGEVFEPSRYTAEGVEGIIWRIDRMPTVDAVEVVRCKDCKYEQQCRKAVKYITYEPTSVTVEYKSVEWCSYGERKEGE